MPTRAGKSLVSYFCRATIGDLGSVTDAELLLRFSKWNESSALDELLRRHGPMLWNVCLRQSYDRAAAEDVFQTTCLVLARKAGQIARPQALSSWLHGVAVRIARREFVIRPRASSDDTAPPVAGTTEPSTQLEVRELFQVLDAELASIPEKLRSPLILCYLEGKTRDQTAAELGLSLGTLKRRLEEGREHLRLRLLRRGVALPTALLTLAAAEVSVPARLLAAQSLRLTNPSALWVELASEELARSASWARGGIAMLAASVVVIGLALGGIGSSSPTNTPVPQASPAPAVADDPLPEGAVARLGVQRFRVPTGERTLVVAADGKTFAVGHPAGVVWVDATTGKELRRFTLTPARVRPVAVSGDGRYLAAVDGMGVVVWDTKAGKELVRITEPGRRPPGIDSLALSAKGDVLAIGDAKGRVRLVSPDNAAITRELTGHTAAVRRIRFSPDGKLLAASASDGTVRVWNQGLGKELYCFEGQSPDGCAVAFDPDGKRLAMAGPRLGTFTLVELTQGKTLWKYTTRGRAARAGFTDVGFSPDNKHPIAGANGGGLWVWTADGELVRESPLAPKGRIGDVMLASQLAVATTDHAVHLWEPVSGRETAGSASTHATTPARFVTAIQFTPDGRTILSSDLNAVRTWDAKTGKLQLRSTSAFGELVGLTPNGQNYFAIRLSDGLVWQREVATGRIVDELSIPNDVPAGLAGCAVSPTADRLAVIDANGLVRLIAWPGGKPIADWQVPTDVDRTGRSRVLRFSQDGKSLAIGTNAGEVRVVAAADGKAVGRLADVGGPVSGLAFGAGAKTLVVSVSDSTGEGKRPAVSLWDLATDKRLTRYGEDVGPEPRPANAGPFTYPVAVSSDGSLMAEAGEGTEIRLRDGVSGKVIRTFKGHAESVAHLALSPCGQYLASVAADGVGLVWRLNRAGPAGD